MSDPEVNQRRRSGSVGGRAGSMVALVVAAATAVCTPVIV